MNASAALEAAVTAHHKLTAAQRAAAEATTARDLSVVEARNSGASAIAIAEALELSRQQVHKILDRTPSAALHALREEVMAPGVRFDDLLEDDQIFVTQGVLELAHARGISLA